MDVPPLDLLIWDMDGTLLQSANVVPDSFIETARVHGQQECSRDEIVALYSLGVPENMLARILGRPPTADEMTFFYKTLAAKADEVEVYPGVVACLSTLQQWLTLAVFTGASDRSAGILLGACGLSSHFDVVVGGDAYPPKPDPGGILAVVEAAGSAVERAAYIGDAPTDIQAAVAAGVQALAAGWGHLHEAGHGEHIIFDQPFAVTDWVLQRSAR